MRPARIIVVEDDRIVARDIAGQLERMGHVVVGTTPRGDDAVAMAARSSPDLVLMDIRLEPGIDGIEAAKAIGESCRAPVIFLTAYADDETLQRATATGAFGYLLKPFDQAQLRASIEMALHRDGDDRALRASEARLRNLATLSSDWYWEQGPDFRFSHLSSNGQGGFDEVEGGVIGKALWEIATVVPLAGSWSHHRAALEARRPFREFEYLYVAVDGKARRVSMSGAPMFDERGMFCGYQGVGRGLTDSRAGSGAADAPGDLAPTPASGWERVEILRRDRDVVLARGVTAGEPEALLMLSAVQEPVPPRVVGRLRHEFSLRDRLDEAWAATPRSLLLEPGRTALLMRDPGGVLLSDILDQPRDIGSFLRIALAIATAVAHAHERGLVHKDIKPEHLLVDEALGQAWLTGFGIASPLLRERQPPDSSDAIAGTFAYMAPEQTGRMNRSIDSRSDLYSMGVVLHRLLDGQLPFEATDAMEWIHCHIARAPAPLRRGSDRRLGALPAILAKLLAKTAEERYQSAAGVGVDLRRCLVEWESDGLISDFVPAEHDGSDRLLIPEKLYGREAEIDSLIESFDSVVATGMPAVVFVSGYSGIGKSSVVNELHKSLVPPRGLFAAGKFDQYKRDIPYATLAQAFQGLVRQILAKSDLEMATWRTLLREALGVSGQLLVNLIPELEAVIGRQPPVAELPAAEALARFQATFRGFLGVFARPEHPLALFLDDLQWLDAATITLLEHLATSPDIRHVLIIGAYRDNEVSPAHPFVRSLNAIRASGAHLRELALSPLQSGDVRQLVADALRTGVDRVGPLADLVHEKTAGNAFFALQFFGDLADRRLLRFDVATHRWTWDVESIRARASTDNVVDLVLGKLSRFPARTRRALIELSCLGNTARIETLALLHGGDEATVSESLWDALQTGLVLRVAGGFAFLHDRVQEAAYALLPESARDEEHLRIGRALLAATSPDSLAEKAFDIANQFDRAIPLITSPVEREQVARLNAVAGRRASVSTAYASARAYFAAGCALLADDGWDLCPELRFELERALAECEFLTGDLVAADERLAAIAPRARTQVQRAAVTWLRVTLYTAMDECPRAVDTAIEYLAELDIRWSQQPTTEEVRSEYELLLSRVGTRAIESLVDLPIMENEERRATVDVLMALLPPAVYTDRNLVLLVLCRTANVSIEFGNTDASAVGYAYLGMYLGPTFNDYQWAYSFSRLGLDLVEKRGLDRFKARVYMTLGYHVAPWTKPLVPGTFDLLQRTVDAANEAGDVNYVGYYWYCLISSHLLRGTPLEEVQRIVENGLAFVTKTNFRLLITIFTAQLMLVKSLRGLTPAPGRFDDEVFSESRYEAECAQSKGLFIAGMMYWIRKLQARFLAGDHAGACAAAANAEPDIKTLYGHLELAEFYFYAPLARAAHFDAATAAERIAYAQSVSECQAQLEVWARCCPENWAARSSLVAAESARIGGRDLEAMRMYEQSTQLARLHGFVNDEAVAHEAAARFYAARGFGSFAEGHLRRGREAFAQWGADAKLGDLDQAFPDVASISIDDRGSASFTRLHELDLANVVKSSQAVSAETDLATLMDTLMTTVLQQAGAERGALIAVRGDELWIEAQARTTHDDVAVDVSDVIVTSQALPESMLRYVLRARESVLLNDASAPNAYSSDPYIVRNRTRSILCLPLLKQAVLIGVLYLENSLAPGVFTPTRLSVLKLLASQAAISLQNARLYAELQRENRDRRQSEAALKRSEERYALAVEAAGDGHTDWIVSTDEFYASPRLLEMCGLGGEERFLGRSDWLARFPFHPEDRERVIMAISEHFASDRERLEFDMRILRGEETRWMHATLLCSRDAAGTLVRASTAVTDFTERVRAQDALQNARSELTRVARLTTVGHLAVSIAHEINQPLAAIVTNAGAGLNFLNHATPFVDEAQQIFDQILYDGKRAAEVIRSLVSLSRKTGPKLGTVDIDDAAREVIALLQTELERNRVKLLVEFATDSHLVEADRIQVQQVLINLVVNAMEAMVEADVDERVITISTEPTTRGTMVSVRDTGPGLGADVLPRIFEPFFTTKKTGTGMGLSICRSIIEGHGSSLAIACTGGRGALFQFELFAPVGEIRR